MAWPEDTWGCDCKMCDYAYRGADPARMAMEHYIVTGHNVGVWVKRVVTKAEADAISKLLAARNTGV